MDRLWEMRGKYFQSSPRIACGYERACGGGGSDHAESDGTVSSDRDGLSDAGADDGRKTSCDDRRADGAEFSAERIEQPCEKRRFVVTEIVQDRNSKGQ